MKKKTKWNYAIVRSIFGDYWIGKTKLKADKIKVFSDVEDCIRLVEEKFLREHCCYSIYKELLEKIGLKLKEK